MRLGHAVTAVAAIALARADAATPPPAAPALLDIARLFGAQEEAISPSLSPDGHHIVYVRPEAGTGNTAVVLDTVTGSRKVVAKIDGKPLRLVECGWSANDRIVCLESGAAKTDNSFTPFSRIASFDIDGTKQKVLEVGAIDGDRISQFDGEILDWLDGTSGQVLMARDYVPDGNNPIGLPSETMQRLQRDGIGVALVDTRTGRQQQVEPPSGRDVSFLADGMGNVRMKGEAEYIHEPLLSGVTRWSYRAPGSKAWVPFSRSGANSGFEPVAVDGRANVAYAMHVHDGRRALYSIALDGSLKGQLVYANPSVDIDGVVTFGRRGRVVGVRYVTDRQHIAYFDPEVAAIEAAVAKALPQLPLLSIVGSSADERYLLLFAASDVDPGHYLVLDRAQGRINDLIRVRPPLAGMTLATVQNVRFKAADGTEIPAYLTLPPKGGKALPAIVMPHGGPASRDEWGFDWLVQFFAQRGFAVLQPEYRGSSGFGDAWYGRNGFQAWRTAIGDINDGARWLAREGIADPSKLAIIGWSYGGYAALQANVVDPNLFKAVVAIAPVADLDLLKRSARDYTSVRLVAQQVGSGEETAAGSPARYADRFKAPVLLFHGSADMTVRIDQSQLMNAALKAHGKQSELIVYPDLDHQLYDDVARSDMLSRADAFLRANLKP